MGRIVVTEYVSLDGVMEAPGGSEEFKHAGWTFEIERGEAGDKFKLDETLNSEALLLGRSTYEVFATSWPSITDDMGFADKFNSMPSTSSPRPSRRPSGTTRRSSTATWWKRSPS
jgi:dihydrofolate reductase